jgi:hypothetical protein
MDPCIVSISNKMQCYTVYLHLETALHVSGGTSTHHQERKQLYLQNLVFVTPLLLSDAIVEELEYTKKLTRSCLHLFLANLPKWKNNSSYSGGKCFQNVV